MRLKKVVQTKILKFPSQEFMADIFSVILTSAVLADMETTVNRLDVVSITLNTELNQHP